jgi:thiamine-monophosphate kinase
MSMMDEIIENRVIGRIARAFERPPFRLNGIHEADAEIIDLGGGSDRYLAVTTDALVEEVASGLYDDPYLIGWMLATVNFSDLAAVGADPVGLLVSMNLSPAQDEAFIGRLSQGISDACRELGTYVLGGDTNEAKDLLLSGTAVGLVPKDTTIRRVGARSGDRLYLSGPAGMGNVFAFLRLARPGFRMPGSAYRPIARLAQGKIVRRFASCCMDTSDGVVHTLDTLMRLNHRRFVLDGRWEQTVHPYALEVCRSHGLPAWLSLAGVHGEFELCFSVEPRKEDAFLAEAAAAGWTPLPMGEIADGDGVCVRKADGIVALDSGFIRNLSAAAGSDQQGYIRRLVGFAQTAGI